MKKFLIPATAIILVLTAAAGGALALTGGGDETNDSAVRESADQERCAAGATACDDPNTIDEGGAGGDALGMCVEGATDCVDTQINGDEPVIIDPNTDGFAICIEGDCVGCKTISHVDACQESAIALVTEDLTAMVGVAPTLVSAEYVDWPDTSLGNPQGEMFYAQVITPGYKIILDDGSALHEYHTDQAGNFTLLD